MIPRTSRYDLINNMSSFDEMKLLEILENIETKFKKRRVVKNLCRMESSVIRSFEEIEPELVFFDREKDLMNYMNTYAEKIISRKHFENIIIPKQAICYKFNFKEKEKDFVFFNMNTLRNFCKEDLNIIVEHEMYHLLNQDCMMPDEEDSFYQKKITQNRLLVANPNLKVGVFPLLAKNRRFCGITNFDL